jgi:hypothetical protein
MVVFNLWFSANYSIHNRESIIVDTAAIGMAMSIAKPEALIALIK